MLFSNPLSKADLDLMIRLYDPFTQRPAMSLSDAGEAARFVAMLTAGKARAPKSWERVNG